jgi:uncharacterized protein YjbJ (UPF0337 family)
MKFKIVTQGAYAMLNRTKGGIWQQMAGKWKQYSGEVRKRWGQLTDDDLDQIHGNRDILIGILQQRYGLSPDEAAQQVEEWASRLT